MARRPGPPRHRRGFTLVEVLVAVVVLAIGVTAVQRLVAGSVRTLDAGTRATRALLAARVLLAEATLDVPPLGRTHGQRDDGMRWTRAVRSTPHPRLREIQVEVDAGDGRTTTLTEVVRVANR